MEQKNKLVIDRFAIEFHSQLLESLLNVRLDQDNELIVRDYILE